MARCTKARAACGLELGEEGKTELTVKTGPLRRETAPLQSAY